MMKCSLALGNSPTVHPLLWNSYPDLKEKFSLSTYSIQNPFHWDLLIIIVRKIISRFQKLESVVLKCIYFSFFCVWGWICFLVVVCCLVLCAGFQWCCTCALSPNEGVLESAVYSSHPEGHTEHCSLSWPPASYPSETSVYKTGTRSLCLCPMSLVCWKQFWKRCTQVQGHQKRWWRETLGSRELRSWWYFCCICSDFPLS